MSFYETPEQRQRRQIDRLERENQQRQKELNELRARADKERRDADRRLREAMEVSERHSQEQARRANESLNRLNAEIQQQEVRHRSEVLRLRHEQEEQARAVEQELQEERVRSQRELRETHQAMQVEIQRERAKREQQLARVRKEQLRDRKRNEENLRRVTAQINAVEQSVQQELQEVNSRITDMEQRTKKEREALRELANYWLEQAQRLSAELNTAYRPEKFEPTKWYALQRQIQNTTSDIAQGRLETAVTNGRAAFQEAFALREELLPQEMQWNQTLAEIRSRETELVEALAHAETRSYSFEVNGTRIRDDKGVDYWTYGNLSVFRAQVQELQNRLNANTEQLSQSELETFQQELKERWNELRLMEDAAVSNLEMAQRRLEMAQRIGEVLGDEFQMRDFDGDFFARENRDAYHAVYQNSVTEDFVTAVITPVVNEDGIVSNHVEIISGIPDNLEEENNKLREIAVEKMKEKVPHFHMDCTGQYENNADEAARMADLDAVCAGDEETRSRTNIRHGYEMGHRVAAQNQRAVQRTSTQRRTTNR